MHTPGPVLQATEKDRPLEPGGEESCGSGCGRPGTAPREEAARGRWGDGRDTRVNVDTKGGTGYQTGGTGRG